MFVLARSSARVFASIGSCRRSRSAFVIGIALATSFIPSWADSEIGARASAPALPPRRVPDGIRDIMHCSSFRADVEAVGRVLVGPSSSGRFAEDRRGEHAMT